MNKTTKNSKSRMPVVGVPTCRHEIDGLNYDCTQHKYLAALYKSAKVLPLQIPLFGEDIEIDAILENIDGIMLTGSHSNIHPRYYQETSREPGFRLDIERDITILPLIRPTIEQGIPLFAICRGFQELNVAYGGSLHTDLNFPASSIKHNEDKALPLAERYNEVHKVNLVSGGKLKKILKVDAIEVNSLHYQGVDRLGENLVAEGYAEDGVIEAVSVVDSKNFAIGVQWHPEWRSTENAVSTLLFSEFGRACFTYADSST